MLVSAVPVYATTYESTQLKVVPDKTTANPGDIITYTIVMGPVSDMGSMQMVLDIPTGLTYVENSGKLADGLKNTLGFDAADWTEASIRTDPLYPGSMINGYASAADYECDTDTTLATFQCKVNNDFTGTVSVGLVKLEFGSCQTFEYHTDRFSVVPTAVTIETAPVAVTGVTIDGTLSLKTSESKTPSYTVNPAEATNKAVSFKSDNTAVATVNETTGEVTGVKEGTATITITTADGNFTDTCVVTVSPTTYTVTFDSAGGSAVTAQNIEAGQKATKPTDPTKAGYDFKGWTLNGSAYDFNTAVNGDITLVATWEQQPAGHTHDYGQGTLPNKWDATHHWKECNDQACPDSAGSIKDKAPHADSDGDGRCDDCDVDLIKISFAPGEGTGTMAAVYVTLLPGSVSYDFTLPANGFTAPSGKSFKCWSVGGSEKAVGAVIPVAANTTVTAVWAGNTYNPRPNYPIYINPTPGSSSTGQIIAAKTFDGGIGLSVAVTILSAMGGAWLAKKKED